MQKQVTFMMIMILIVGCSEKQDPTESIYNEAKSLENAGKTLEALARYEALAEYPESEMFLKAKAELLNQGISIESARSSWTIKKQIKIQNKIMRFHEINGTFPPIASLGDLTDAWHKPMLIEYQPTNVHLFKMRSSGPDTVMMNVDDLLLSYRNDKKRVRSKQTDKNSEIVVGLDELSKLENTENSEIQANLKNLEKLDEETSNTSEKTVNLNELLKTE